MIAAEQCYAKLNVLVPQKLRSSQSCSLELRCSMVCWTGGSEKVKSLWVRDVKVCRLKEEKKKVKLKIDSYVFEVASMDAASTWLHQFEVLFSYFAWCFSIISCRR